MAKAKKKAWSYIAGEKGRNRVRAFEQDGRLYLEWTEGGKRNRLPLPHTDKVRAKQAADTTAAEYATHCAEAKAAREKLTLRTLFEMYLREKTPEKGQQKQQHDLASAQMFLTAFGADREPRTLALQDWDRFIRERRAGRLVPSLRKSNQGKRPKETGPRTVGNRTIEYDLKFIIGVLNWATFAGDGHGGYLLDRNPFKGFQVPKEKAPTRAIISDAEYAVLLTAARSLDWRNEVLLVLAHETGHRVGAIRQLRWTDVDLRVGMVHWPEHSDKIGMPHSTALTPAAVAALEKARTEGSSIGNGWVFPSLRDPGQPAGKEFASKAWREMERKARMPRRKGVGFHSLRRKFATDLKDVPLRDVLELGGWRNEQTVLRCYQAAPTAQRQLDILTRRSAVMVS